MKTNKTPIKPQPVFNKRQRRFLRCYVNLLATKYGVTNTYVRLLYTGMRSQKTEIAQGIIRDSRKIISFMNELISEKI